MIIGPRVVDRDWCLPNRSQELQVGTLCEFRACTVLGVEEHGKPILALLSLGAGLFLTAIASVQPP
jgi:hypothetical protein